MRWRLLFATLGVVAIMLVAQDVPLAGYLRDVERDRLLTDLERDAFIMAGQAGTALRPVPTAGGDAESQRWQLDTLADAAAANAGADGGVVVVGADGVVVVSAGTDVAAEGDDLAGDADIVAALAQQPAAGPDGGDTVSVAVPVLEGADTIGAVRLSAPSAVIDERADRRLRGLYWVAGISLAAAVVVALLISWSVTGPLRRLQRSTDKVAAGQFDVRVDEGEGPPEVRALARSFNAMTAQIARLVEQQRSFAGDASHQLRTPLTALRLQLERTTALVEDDPAGAHRNLDAAADEIARLQRLIDGLLLLSRAGDTKAADRVVVRVDELVTERAEVWGPLAEEQGVVVTTWVNGLVSALAVPGALDQIVDNYIDNALTVAPAGTAIEVVVDTDGRDEAGAPVVTVHVLDRGPGLGDEELAAAFGRFWRAPGNQHDGTGLGLAIVAHLAASSGGAVALARRPGGGLDASVRLPAALVTPPPAP